MGKVREVANWPAIRRQALDRDGWHCRECGKGGRLEVHHVQHLEDGGSNELENLLTLCGDCHKAQHQPRLSPAQQDLVALVRELVR